MSQLSPIDPLLLSRDLAEMEFHALASFNEGGSGVFWSEAGGPSPWEMHPDCDEMLQILEGEVEVEVLPLDGGSSQVTKVGEGEYIVVPKGCWHRQTMLQRSVEHYLTPGRTLHSLVPDPRVVEQANKMQSHIRNGFGSVRAYVYGDLQTLRMVEAAFAPVEIERNEMGEKAFHIDLRIGDSMLVLEVSDPPYPEGFPGSIYVYVEDTDAAYKLALAAGASSVAEPEDKPYGERQGGVKDHFGNVWWISTLIDPGLAETK